METAQLPPGFLNIPPDKKIIWVSFPYRGSNLHLLLTKLEESFGIVNKRYMQFHSKELDAGPQEDALNTVRDALRQGMRTYAILINEAASTGIMSFFTGNNIPTLAITLEENEESLRIALVEALKHVSRPFPKRS